jgi:hypothetical protein
MRTVVDGRITVILLPGFMPGYSERRRAFQQSQHRLIKPASYVVGREGLITYLITALMQKKK